MPKYDYRCENCQHEFEVTQSIKDDVLTVCPQCEGTLRRVIGQGLGISF